jgi:hypothetical protein|tara:strand:+ start:407 stop:640 length:234 start_codon:yes stop_codon:yes gene_type:complete
MYIYDMNVKQNTKICSICGSEYTGWGHNPAPVIDIVKHQNARCCDGCNSAVVTPTRIDLHLNKVKLQNFVPLIPRAK